jgi:putative spermidine/putrescine transport system substrate-binding protein
MKLRTLFLQARLWLLPEAAALATDMTLVSWGGAYQDSQKKAYAEPYMANNPDINIIWDESSAEAVAKLRAMNEAGNITWDLVDVVASDAHPPVRRRPRHGNRPDEILAAAPDGTLRPKTSAT